MRSSAAVLHVFKDAFHVPAGAAKRQILHFQFILADLLKYFHFCISLCMKSIHDETLCMLHLAFKVRSSECMIRIKADTQNKTVR